MNNTQKTQITISYGYDIHSLVLSTSDFEKIKSGQSMDIDGQGFSIEGKISQDIWSFNNKEIRVICKNGFDVFQGTLDEIISVENVLSTGIS
jgi:hypothetical protein